MAVRYDPSMSEICAVCDTEEAAIDYCRQQGLIPTPQVRIHNARVGDFWGICGDLGFNPDLPNCYGRVITVNRRYKNGPKPQYYCGECRKQLSQQNSLAPIGGAANCTWFASIDAAGRPNSKISKRAVLWIMYILAKNMSVRQTIELAEGSLDLDKTAVIDWRNFARELMTASLEQAPRMGGVGQIVQIDESLFRGRRKYQRGRLLLGDGIPGRRQNNHGQRIEGPWVFGILDTGTGEIRLFRVERRDAATLLPIIVANVEPGTTIWSDEWAAYQRIPQCIDTPVNGGRPMRYNHESVNHTVEFVAQGTGANTQRLEREWERCKLQLMRLNKGTSPALLPGHLAAFWWQSMNGPTKCNDPFLRLLALIREHYPQV